MTDDQTIPAGEPTPPGSTAGGDGSSSEADARAATERRSRWTARFGQIGVPVVLVLLIVVFSLTATDFLSGSNVKTIFSDAAFPTIAAVGLTVCLVMGEFDLSLNGVAGLATVLVAVLVAREGMGTIPAIFITLLGCGLMVGLLNGVLVGFLGLSALIVTIAVNSALIGLQYVVSDTKQIFGGFPEGFVSFARGEVGPAPVIVLLAIATAFIIWATLEHTTLGRQLRAVGGNEEAARIAGVNTGRTKVWGFVICSLLVAIAGTLFAGKQTAAFPLSGLDILLPSYAACFIGAAAFKVGEFSVPGTLIGVLIATVTSNGLLLLGVANYATYLIQAGILLVALLFARSVATRGALT